MSRPDCSDFLFEKLNWKNLAQFEAIIFATFLYWICF